MATDDHRTADPCTYNENSLSPVPVNCFNYLWHTKGLCTTSFIATEDPNILQLVGSEERFPILGQTLGSVRRQMAEAAENPLWNPPLCNRSGAATIVGERTKLKELDMLVTQYTTAHNTYINDDQSGDLPAAGNALAVLKALNDNILSRLTELQKMNDSIYPRGITNQQTIEKNNPTLNAHLQDLYKQHAIVNQRIRDYNDASGKKEDKELTYHSNTWPYIFYFVMAFIVAIFVIRAYTSEDQNSLEMVILIVAAILAIVHFYKYIVKKLT